MSKNVQGLEIQIKTWQNSLAHRGRAVGLHQLGL